MRDADGQALSYVCYESELGRRSAAKLLSKDEARRIAANIAKLPITENTGTDNGTDKSGSAKWDKDDPVPTLFEVYPALAAREAR